MKLSTDFHVQFILIVSRYLLFNKLKIKTKVKLQTAANIKFIRWAFLRQVRHHCATHVRKMMPVVRLLNIITANITERSCLY